MLLRHRDGLRGAVDLARRDLDDAAHVGPARSLEHVQRADDVRGHELARVPVGVRDRDQRAEMEDDLAALRSRPRPPRG